MLITRRHCCVSASLLLLVDVLLSPLSCVHICAAQVARANQLLSVYRAVAALRADEVFQEDASDPQVQAALTDMGMHNNMDK